MIAHPDFVEQIMTRQPGVLYAWGYGRQSNDRSIDANEALPQQGLRIRRYYDAYLDVEGVKWGGFIPDDSAVSARTNPFMLRHAGRTLFDLMKSGDYFVIDKVDRLWRSMEDFVDVMRQFKARGIKLCIVNMMGVGSITLGTPMGDAFMNMAITFAQLESDQCSDRTRARFADRRLAGKYPGSRTPLGCKLIGEVEKVNGRVVHDSRLFIWCPDQRKFMGEIVRLADEEGLNCSDVRGLMLTHFREFMGERFFKSVIAVKDWPAFTIAKNYWRERQYRALPQFDPNSIKFSIFDLPKNCGTKHRDIGRSEPNIPNPYPFLDGRPVPSLKELRTWKI